MQEELRTSEEKYRSLMEKSMEMMYILDLEGNILEVNQKTVDRTGYSREKLLQMRFFDLCPHDTDLSRIKSAWKNMTSGSSINQETVHVTRTSRKFPVEISFNRITCGSCTHILALVRDITETLKARNELIEARDRAVAASRAKLEFLASMSHEIRTPMAGILGSLEMILEQSTHPEQKKLLKMTLDSAASLQQIINDILDLSKVEAGKIKIENRKFSPAEVVSRVIQLFKIPAGNKNILLHAVFADNYPQLVQGDPCRLEQILRNLVSNAVKFTDKGEILLRTGVRKPAHDPLQFYFQVQDTGPGIPEEFQKRIFESFTQADSTYARQFQGTGLGLAISCSLARMMNGSIDLTTAPGQGSTFTLHIPLSPVWERAAASAEPGSEQDAALSSPENLHILLAEDMDINQAFITHLLTRKGHQVQVAPNGRQALRLFETDRFDLILMDIQMPEMDGVQVTRRIRELEQGPDQRFTGHIPIIALTACAMAEEKEKFLAAGMDGYVAKPVNKKELYSEIARTVRCFSPFQGCNTKDRGEAQRTALEAGPEHLTDIPVDLREIEVKYSGHHAFWKSMFKRFVDEDLPGYIQELQTYAAENDLDSLFAVAHKLKGGLGTLCALQAAEKAAALDQAVRNRLTDQIPAALDNLLAELDKLPPYRNILS
ncbi:MAG: ATP-binding protein [Desulfonatronovibrionaceae bacterium]